MSFHSAGLARALDDMHDFHRQREIAAPILPGRREGERDYSIARVASRGLRWRRRSSGAIVSIRLNVRFGSEADMCDATAHVRFGPKADIVPLYSITSSARPSNDRGTLSPRDFAVLRFMTSSSLVNCCTGRSAGFSPRRMRPA
jgi:hypothetical protein